MKSKNKIVKESHHNRYKNYRNLISTLLKRAEEKYFTNVFNENIKAIKKTRKGIKTLVLMKQKYNEKPSLITKDKKYINDTVSIANTFNNLFTSATKTVHSKFKFLNKSFRNFLSSEINYSFIITSTNKDAIYR